MNDTKTIEVPVKLEMKPVESSNIAFIGYLSATKTLYVEFNSGATYQYHAVPQAVYNELMAAESHGKYLNAKIKGTYDYTKLA